jgi:hypothetical protein
MRALFAPSAPTGIASGLLDPDLIANQLNFISLQSSSPIRPLTGFQIKRPPVHRTGDLAPIENALMECGELLVGALIPHCIDLPFNSKQGDLHALDGYTLTSPR